MQVAYKYQGNFFFGRIDIGSLEIKVSCTIKQPEILDTTIDYIDEVGDERKEINIKNATSKLSNGHQIPFTTYTEAFQEELHRQHKLFELVTKNYETNNGILINKLNNAFSRIKGMTFTGVLKKIDSNHNNSFPIIDQVRLDVKAIFEEKAFTILESGLILENKSNQKDKN